MPAFDATIGAARRGGAVVEVPDAFVGALGGGRARIPVRATFDGVPYTGSIVSMGGAMVLAVQGAHRREHVGSVEDARRPETSARRVDAVVARLRSG